MNYSSHLKSIYILQYIPQCRNSFCGNSFQVQMVFGLGFGISIRIHPKLTKGMDGYINNVLNPTMVCNNVRKSSSNSLRFSFTERTISVIRILAIVWRRSDTSMGNVKVTVGICSPAFGLGARRSWIESRKSSSSSPTSGKLRNESLEINVEKITCNQNTYELFGKHMQITDLGNRVIPVWAKIVWQRFLVKVY